MEMRRLRVCDYEELLDMLNSTFAVFSNAIKASTQSIINAVLLVVFLIYLSNEHRFKAFLRPIRK